ncbi:MAG TPA: PHP domain-containing protein [Bryobacteraceae bacterium]|nr:PHP domain-containing protein [Bryobacteraceae bacterium]
MTQFIDLHSHTTESDGSLSPSELVALAAETGLSALAITDHDTLSGFLQAREPARAVGLDLVCGIELNTRMSLDGPLNRRAVHLLAYFLSADPPAAFAKWLEGEQKDRRDRNARLAAMLRSHGLDVRLEEVELRGKSLTGRPHFARVLVEKGYVKNAEEAFAKYLGEQAPTYVERQSRTAEEVIGIVRSLSGVPVVAHPVRLSLPREQERALLLKYKAAGLAGLEIYHSEHPPELQAYYHQLAAELELLPTGGSDFHGEIKRDIDLGTGFEGNVRVPLRFLDDLRSAFVK